MIKRLFNILISNINHFLDGEKPAEDLGREAFSFTENNNETKFKIPFSSAPNSLAQYYSNLEVSPDSSLKDVKAAWKRLIKKYHPDLHSSDPKKREIATELTCELNKAYRAIEEKLKNKMPTI